MSELVSPYLIAALAGWLAAHLVKYAIATVQGGGMVTWRYFYISGGMPSSHSSAIMAVLTVIGALDGVNSGLFGLGAIIAGIVMYDAMMVRRSSGEQGDALKALLKEQKSKVAVPRVAKGHTPLEVLVGAVTGAVVGLLVVSFF